MNTHEKTITKRTLVGVVGIFLALSVVGCLEDDDMGASYEDVSDFSAPPMALMAEGAIGTITVNAIQSGVQNEQELTYEIIDGNRIHQGDIMLGKEEPSTTVNPDSCVMTTLGNAWSNGVVYYTFGAGITAANQNSILGALRAWENVSALRFVERTTQNDYIEFFNGTGCWSYVGRQGGKQQISLQDNASGTCMGQGTIMHEVGHSVGLWHEQSRQDRDSFVTVDLCYCQAGKEHNFNKEVSTAVGGYDYVSLMHYSSSAFRSSLRTDKAECAGKPTSGYPLLRKNGSLITPSSAPTTTDIAGVASIYGVAPAADIIWQHNSGQVHYWPMKDGVRQGGYNIYTPVDSTWTLRGVGDMNGDGTDDIVWQHNSGQVHYWPMLNGVRQGGYNIFTPVDSTWTLRGVGDVNGDGTDDIVWQHNSGQVHYWPMKDGVRQGGYDIFTPVDSTWTLVGVGNVN